MGRRGGNAANAVVGCVPGVAFVGVASRFSARSLAGSFTDAPCPVVGRVAGIGPESKACGVCPWADSGLFCRQDFAIE